MFRIVLQIHIVLLTLSTYHALKPMTDLNEDEVKTFIQEHLTNIPDIDNKYVINEGISKMISKHYKGKVNVFPLYKLSLKIDRQPVKIPWTIDSVSPEDKTPVKKKYQYIEAKP